MTLVEPAPSPGTATENGPTPIGPKPVFEGTKGRGEQIALYTFVIVPFLAVLAAVPVAWGWGLSWTDVVLFAVFYAISGLGITVGYHRHFTHGSFKANRPLRIALAVAGGLAIEGPVIRWVADHRRHHAFSDREGDPALAVALREFDTGADEGPGLRPRRLDVRRRAHQPREVHSGSDRATRQSSASIACSRSGWRSRFWVRRCSAV